MDEQSNEGVAANDRQIDANAAGYGDPNVPGNGQAEPVAPSLEEMAAKRHEENLAKARENGYRDPDDVHPVERVKAILASMEHQAKHNGPIAPEMIRELRDALRLPKEPEPAADKTA